MLGVTILTQTSLSYIIKKLLNLNYQSMEYSLERRGRNVCQG